MQAFDANEFIELYGDDDNPDCVINKKHRDKSKYSPVGGTSKMKDVLEQNDYYSKESFNSISKKIKINDKTK